jgi:class 3 adenylate cyclase
MDVGAWLRSLGLERYEATFRDNSIDDTVLLSLTAEDLKDLGVSSVGHRRKLLDAIATLRGTSGKPRDIDADRSPPAATETPTVPGERRQVSVLFADLAGYTKLSAERDAEEVHALLTAFFEEADAAILAHGGTIDKHIGDCVLAVFGAPVAHGNDAERAVHAALAIRETMPVLSRRLGLPLGVHVGVASGEVVASPTGSEGHRSYTVTGETVNLASRLTGHAGSGEIMVSAAIHRALGDQLDCNAVGEVEVKGLARPVPMWRLSGLRKTGGSDARPKA